MCNQLLEKVLGLISDVSFKTRVLREWQESHVARKPEYSERQVLILQLVKNYAPITEKELGKIFGLPTSSINDLIEKLVIKGLVEKIRKQEGDSRERIVHLTDKGDEQLAEIIRNNSTLYEYLVNKFQQDELKNLVNYLTTVSESVGSAMEYFVLSKH